MTCLQKDLNDTIYLIFINLGIKRLETSRVRTHDRTVYTKIFFGDCSDWILCLINRIFFLTWTATVLKADNICSEFFNLAYNFVDHAGGRTSGNENSRTGWFAFIFLFIKLFKLSGTVFQVFDFFFQINREFVRGNNCVDLITGNRGRF